MLPEVPQILCPVGTATMYDLLWGSLPSACLKSESRQFLIFIAAEYYTTGGPHFLDLMLIPE